MNTILSSFASALDLILHPDAELISIILRTLHVSGAALLLATIVGVPMGALLALRKFRGRGMVTAVLNAFMGLPPVVVGLLVYMLLSRSGPMGFMGLLYSPTAMIVAQFILALPIVTALTSAAVVGVDPAIKLAAQTLGATPSQQTASVVREARYGILAAVIAGLGRVMAEVGAILIVGGNIKGYTRVMTTTIALETDKGEFTLALALGIILLMISIVINMALHVVQKSGARSQA